MAAGSQRPGAIGDAARDCILGLGMTPKDQVCTIADGRYHPDLQSDEFRWGQPGFTHST
jgi:hypothetical protein